MLENTNSNSIKNWAIDDRPREKLLQKGKEALSNAELLAILINNGFKDKSALQLSQDILQLCNNNLNQLHKLNLNDFKKIKGIGSAKAVTIIAALELGKRRHLETILQETKFDSPANIAEYLKTKLQNEEKEFFAVLYLNNALKLLHYQVISSGGITGTVADPRIIFKIALEQNATCIVVCHNHPSGRLEPSKPDVELTKKLEAASKLMQIQLIDHIIVSHLGHYSFAVNGLL